MGRRRKLKPELPRCIAWVKRRSGAYGEPDTEAHRCNWRAHAFTLTGVSVCRLHAGVRERRAQPVDPNQIVMEGVFA